MAVVTILGAGAMGSALTTPARAAGHEVRLWGTWLDDAILAELRADRPHPRIGVRLDAGVRLFDSDDLGTALTDADLVVLAISSEGVLDVLGRAAGDLRPGVPLLVTTKGFGRDPAGRVSLLPPLLADVLPDPLRVSCPIVAIGGPCKANEVGAARPTATVFACPDRSTADRCAGLLGTAPYRIRTTEDIVGVESSAAMKNVYAIALGVADGLAEAHSDPWHNLKAAAFAQAVDELARIAVAMGGRRETAVGLAGVGDLEVTGLSGRNKLYGARIGRGEPAALALATMVAAEQTVEGVAAARFAADLAVERSITKLPLLAAVVDVLDGDPDPAERISEAVLPPRR
jgi:glycerol-3-phosphate dehydrogenase (NAD(P)+)